VHYNFIRLDSPIHDSSTYLLTLRLFFLLPNRPWMITIGSPFALPLLSWRLYARSITLRLDDAWKDRAHNSLGVTSDDCILEACFGCRKGVYRGCIVRGIERMVNCCGSGSFRAGTFLMCQAFTSYLKKVDCKVLLTVKVFDSIFRYHSWHQYINIMLLSLYFKNMCAIDDPYTSVSLHMATTMQQPNRVDIISLNITLSNHQVHRYHVVPFNMVASQEGNAAPSSHKTARFQCRCCRHA
jgi:hypothetical protein